jgi:hypothetical protein
MANIQPKTENALASRSRSLSGLVSHLVLHRSLRQDCNAVSIWLPVIFDDRQREACGLFDIAAHEARSYAYKGTDPDLHH